MARFLVVLVGLMVLTAAPACGGSSCPTSEELAYLTAVPIYQEEATMGAESVSGLLAQAATEPSLLITEAWRVDMAVALSRMETGARALADRDAPASLSQIDGLHKTSATKMLEAVGLYKRALNRPDRAAVEQAAALVTSAGEDRARAASAADGFCEE